MTTTDAPDPAVGSPSSPLQRAGEPAPANGAIPAGEQAPPHLPEPARQHLPEPVEERELDTGDGDDGTHGSRSSRLSMAMVLTAVCFWLAAALIGTLGQSLSSVDPDQFLSLEGEPVDRCLAINPAVTAEGNWCTPTQDLGETLPSAVTLSTGEIAWSDVSTRDVVEAVFSPELWLTLGVGGSALLVFVAFARATGTIRAGLAAAVSIVFLGLLLFPVAFTGSIAEDMRAELVSAWKWVILFYFGSEAAVQARRIASGDPGAARGDMPA